MPGQRRRGWTWLLGLVLALPATPGPGATAPEDAGQRLYRSGVRASGEPLQATVQGGVALQGGRAACVNCHRRSGLGGSEGGRPVRPVTGPQLFGDGRTVPAGRWAVPAAGSGQRPPYDRASLGRALRDGIDSAGRRLDGLMPRYVLDDREVEQLHGYLQTLSARPAPGVDADEIHFATVIAPDAAPARRAALLEVLQAWVRDHNRGTRQEARRRAVGAERMYQAWRRWVLHAWTLDGPPADWPRQLEAHYAGRPVFAVLGGLGGGHWEPVHRFCEARELPCVFPDIDRPPAMADHHSLYFSLGMAQEAEVLARHLAAFPAQRVAQLVADDGRARAAAEALHGALAAQGRDVERHPVGHPSPWPEHVPHHLVAWAGADALPALFASPPPAGLRRLYLSAYLTDDAELQRLVPPAWRERVRLVTLFAPPAGREAHLAQLRSWLRLRGLPAGEERTRANAFFAAAVPGEALAHLGDNFSRDYFIERIEQMAGSTALPSAYPPLSLGPGQRIGARGGQVVALPDPEFQAAGSSRSPR